MGGGGPNYEPRQRTPSPAELVIPERQERIAHVLEHRTLTLTVVLEQLEDHFNMAAVLRTCEAMGLQRIHIIPNPAVAFEPNATVTQGCDKWLDLCVHANTAQCFNTLRAEGFSIQVSALQQGATSLFELDFGGKVALVFGNERFGVSAAALEHCDGVFWIPMRGFTQSLNISAAASASITQAVAWRVRHRGTAGDLQPEQREALRETFLRRSVKQRGRLWGSKK